MIDHLPAIALSIRQPWAWLVANGWKDIENRTWRTRFRGSVLVHAGKAPMDEDEWDDIQTGRNLVDGSPIASDYIPPGENLSDIGWGGIVGVAEIIDCVTTHRSRWFVGPFGFVIRNARPLPFQKCRGQLGFFTPFIDDTNRQSPAPTRLI